ncbi:predicted protein [Histoplasma capsulatum G186AR]|uniref:Uncharacterized protein n=1 Tax=Ajellomyces capsulatus (strain G186AR / H82 / ATCC MYA-2454 / RMSCC 2432) TaxID=447093 RepID=C0NXD4_AJECG|nr:uncharacterized protein HCBG_08126 [Histoplasma capsulatum G186AR]EEH04000.1 predicted protein [Histoplasma capsulatum G186AR]
MRSLFPRSSSVVSALASDPREYFVFHVLDHLTLSWETEEVISNQRFWIPSSDSGSITPYIAIITPFQTHQRHVYRNFSVKPSTSRWVGSSSANTYASPAGSAVQQFTPTLIYQRPFKNS